MDVLYDDIMNLILSLLPKHALIALQHTCNRFHKRMRVSFPYASRNHLQILGEIFQSGNVCVLRWFLGRAKSDLRWSLRVNGVQTLLLHGNIFSLILALISCIFSDLAFAQLRQLDVLKCLTVHFF